MTIAIWAVAAYSIVATTTHIGSILIAMSRCRKPKSASRPAKSETALGLVGLTRYLRRTGLRAQRSGHCASAPSDVVGVSLVRPVCGMENHIEETLRSAFHLDYPRYEVIFCAASANDAAAPLVRRLIAAHPHVPARLLIGNETVSDNPKLNNVCKGWRAAAYDWIVMADSNVLMPRDYIERLRAAWRPDTGVVSSPPAGCRPQGFWAAFDCSRPSPRRMRPRPNSCATWGCAFAWSTRRSSSRSAIAPPAKCGRVNCAGRSCGRPRSDSIMRWSFWPAVSPRSPRPRMSLRHWGCRWAASLQSRPCGMAPKPRSRAQPDGT